MKKFYLLFATFVAAMGIAVWAADTDFDYEADTEHPLITDVAQFSSPWDDPEEGNFYALLGETAPDDVKGAANDFWHSSWHASPAHDVQGSHYLQVELYDLENIPDQIVFVYTRRDVANDQTLEWSVRGTNDPDADKESCEELAYVLTPLGQTNETLTSQPFSTGGYKYLRFYSEVQGSTGSYGSRVYFHIARFQLYPLKSVDEVTAAQQMIQAAFDKYLQYYDAFPIGIAAGEYGEEEVLAFQDAVNTLDLDMMDPDVADNLTKAKAQEMIDAVEAAYQAVLASKVTFELASGYYRIRTGMDYYNDVVVGQDDEGNDITESQQRVKYLMADRANGNYRAIWGTPEDYEEATQQIRPLFKVTNEGDGTYDVVSMMYDVRFNDVARSTDLLMSAESQNRLAFEAVGTLDDISYVNIRVATQDADGFLYMHQNSHNNGKGNGGTIVGWERTWNEAPAGSEWYFEAVDDAEAESIIAAWQPELQRQTWVEAYRTMYAEASAAITAAKDVAHVALVTDASQLVSPFSDADEGQHIEYLIDGDPATFWHSDWHGATHMEDKHYLQVELPDGVELPVVMQFTRRDNNNNQITKWSVYGTQDNDEAIIQDDLEVVVEEINTPFSSQTETLVSEPFDTKGFKYLRFYCEEQSAGNTFFHLAEFNLYVDKENPNSQYSKIGQPAIDLEAVLAEQADVADADLTQEQVDKLTAAYDAFKAQFVDPQELRTVIAQVEGKAAPVVVGTQPGFWPNSSTADALNATLAAAKAYDEAGNYNKAQSTQYVETLQAQAQAIDDAVIKVQEGKWYRFRLATEEEYDTYEWNKAGNEATTNDQEMVTNEGIFGKYITVAESSSNDGINSVSAAYAQDVAMGHYLYVDDDEDIEEKDLSLFRFINVGDTAFIIQNKATGLYLERPTNVATNVRFIRLSVSPSLFTQGIAGYGQNYFNIKNLEGTGLEALHAATSLNVVQTWSGWGNSDGRRGSFFVEEAGDVATDYNATAFNIDAKPGTVEAYCFPLSVKGESGMYGVNAATVTADGVSLTLVPIKEAAAGRPFLVVLDGEYDAEASDEQLIPFAHGTELVTEAGGSDIMHGVFYGKTVGDGVITFSANKVAVSRSPQQKVYDSSAYITNGEDKFSSSLGVTITIDAEGEDGIQAALQSVARTGNIYTLDGQLVGRGNLNSLRQKGIYIINGTKVVVK